MVIFYKLDVKGLTQMDYPNNEEKTSVVRIKKGLMAAIDEFLKTEIAKRGGFDRKTDVVNAAVRQLLEKYGVHLQNKDLKENF